MAMSVVRERMEAYDSERLKRCDKSLRRRGGGRVGTVRIGLGRDAVELLHWSAPSEIALRCIVGREERKGT